MATKNDITGDKIQSKTTNQKAYAKGWDAIFGKKKKKTTKNTKPLKLT